jgi:hypothetical protein
MEQQKKGMFDLSGKMLKGIILLGGIGLAGFAVYRFWQAAKAKDTGAGNKNVVIPVVINPQKPIKPPKT